MLSSKVWHGLSGDTLHIHWLWHWQRRLADTHMHVVSPSEVGFLADMSDSFRALVQRLWEGESDILLFTARWCLLTPSSVSYTQITFTHSISRCSLSLWLFLFFHPSELRLATKHQTFFIGLTFVQCAFCSPTHKHTHPCSGVVPLELAEQRQKPEK